MKVLIVDDHAVVRDGLALLIQDAFVVDSVHFAQEGREAIQLAMQHSFDLILLDLSMPDGLDGILALLELRKLQPKARIVIFSMYDEEVYQQKAYENGADGYLVKRMKGDELVRALDRIMLGKKLFPTVHPDPLAHGGDERVESAAPWVLPLSPRETEVFTLTVLGHSQREIAERLGISVKTVENHRQHISQKLGLSKRSDWLEVAKKYKVFELY
jgi:two-component system response regulator NreC